MIGHDNENIIQPENFPYPIAWANYVTVFQFWCGLGLDAALHLDEAHQFSQRTFLMSPINGAGRKGKQIITTYRFGEGQYFIGRNKKVSSIYLPRGASVTLHEFDFSDPNFANGRSLKLSSHGVTNLVDFGLDNQITAIEVIKVQFIPDDVRGPG